MLKIQLPVLAVSLAFAATLSIANEKIQTDTGEQWSFTNALDSEPRRSDIADEIIVQFTQSSSPSLLSRLFRASQANAAQVEIEQIVAANQANIIDRATHGKNTQNNARSIRSLSTSTTQTSEYLVQVNPVQRAQLMKALKAQGNVNWVEPNYVYYTNEQPNDPYYTSQKLWGLTTLNMPQAWEITKGAGSVVAIIDTGVDRLHADLASNIWQNSAEIPNNGIDDDGNGFIDDDAGWDFVYRDNNPNDIHSHGTHVAGTVAAIHNNNLGVVGVAPEAKILPLKALGDTGSGSAFDIAKAIRYAADMGADVINMSLGGQGRSQTLANAIDYAIERNVVVVVAAGNDNINSQYQYPANAAGVISVGALQNYFGLDKSSFSNYGPDVDVFAPGSSIYSLAPNNGYSSNSGTSMAAPHVAGLAALLRSVSPNLSPASVRARMIATSYDAATSDTNQGWDETFGYGMINPTAALQDASIAAQGSPEITSPFVDKAAGDNLMVNGVVSLKGSTNTAQLAYYDIALASTQQSPRQFTTLFSGTQSVTNDTLMQWDTTAYADGSYILRLRCVDTDGRFTDTFHQVHVDHSLKTGWPVLNSFWLGHPGGKSDGKLVARAPALIDLDNDGDLEILAVDNNAYQHKAIRAWHHNGQRYGDYTFIFPSVEEIATAITIADINGDNEDDIIFGARLVSQTQRDSVYAYNKQGELLPGFPSGWSGERYLNEDVVNSFDDRIMVADLTGDGRNELIMQKIHWNNTRRSDYVWELTVIDGDGNLLPGFPIQQSFNDLSSLFAHSNFMYPLTLADWQENGHTDIVVLWPNDNAGVQLRVYDVHANQLAAIELPADQLKVVKNPLVIDLDNDAHDELMVQVNDQLLAYTMFGQVKAGWPVELPTQTSSFVGTPGRFFDNLIATDIDNNGSPELLLNGASEAFSLNNVGALFTAHIDLNRHSSNGRPVRTLLDSQRAQQALVYGSSNYANALQARYLNGDSVAGWPKAIAPVSGGVAIGDIDNDGQLDIVAHTLEGFLYAWQWGPAADPSQVAWHYDHGNAQQTRARITPHAPKACTAQYPSMTLRGTFNGWATLPMSFNSAACAWQANVDLTSASTVRFKFDVYGDWSVNFGDQNADGKADQNGADIQKTLDAGKLQVQFNDVSGHYQAQLIAADDGAQTANVTFTCHNGYTQMGQSVYVVGNHASLGQWKVVSPAQRLSPNNYPSWQATLSKLPSNTDIEWKCVIADEKTFAIVQWQNGANNQVRTGNTGSTLNATGYLQ